MCASSRTTRRRSWSAAKDHPSIAAARSCPRERENPVAKSSKRPVGRRGFLKTAAAGAAAVVAQPPSPTLAAQQAVEPPAGQPSRFVEHPQSDYMVDVIRALGIEYVAANPGSSFEGLHESIINYGENRNPELLTALHEESAVAMAHGYAKAEGKPMGVVLHGVIGIQHAAMAIYNAYCDRVPVFLMAGVDV
ncbi:MAG: thiamine pyrophosphate-binding protein, partial [Candidatus Rokuibacteriota bacterium]